MLDVYVGNQMPIMYPHSQPYRPDLLQQHGLQPNLPRHLLQINHHPPVREMPGTMLNLLVPKHLPNLPDRLPQPRQQQMLALPTLHLPKPLIQNLLAVLLKLRHVLLPNPLQPLHKQHLSLQQHLHLPTRVRFEVESFRGE